MSQAMAVVRAGCGLLLLTRARPRAAGTMLDGTEVRGQLTATQKTAQRLSDAATTQQVLLLAANDAFDPLTQAQDIGGILHGGIFPQVANSISHSSSQVSAASSLRRAPAIMPLSVGPSPGSIDCSS